MSESRKNEMHQKAGSFAVMTSKTKLASEKVSVRNLANQEARKVRPSTSSQDMSSIRAKRVKI